MSKYLVLLSLAALTLSGCGDGLGLLPVEGTIKLDGAPLVGAEVIFRPENGRPSLGVTDSQGKYKLRYAPDQDGALPGKHTVSISTTGEAAASSDEEDASASPKKESVPEKYNTKSTLQVDLVSGKSVPTDFNLESK